jgi:hypothetical protein
VTISDNAAGAPHVVTLSGSGTAVADAVRPTVTARGPVAGATGVAVASNLTATFSEAVTGVTATTFGLRLGTATTGATLAGTVTQAGNLFTLNPTANLLANTQYTVTLTGGATAIRDLAGNTLVTTSWSFSTPDTIAPTAIGSTPANNATAVVAANNLTATFSEAMSAITVSAANITLRAGTAATGTLIGTVVTYNVTTHVVTINPNANLANDTRYTVRLGTGLRDAAGNALAAVSWTFLTGPAPTIGTLSPANNGTAVAVAANVTGIFSEAVTGVNATNVTVRVGTTTTGTLVPAAVSFTAATRTLTINPTANLANDTRYTVRLSGAIADTAGNPLAATSWTFLTGPAPSVTARTPAINAVGVGRASNMTATFSEAMAATTNTTGATLRVGTTATGTLIAATVTYNATTRVVTINPTQALLAANTQYTVRLTGMRDTAGNPLPTVTWSFTTGAA